MSIIEEAKKLEAFDVTFYICIFLATVAPGFLTIYLFKPELISSLDTAKLIIFSISIALPAYSINYIVMLIDRVEGESIDFKLSGVMAGSVTSVTFYGTLMSAYFLALNFKIFVALFFLINFGIYIMLFFISKLIKGKG